MSRILALRIAATASVIFTSAAAAFILTLGIASTIDRQPINTVAFVATAFQLASLITLIYVTWRTTRQVVDCQGGVVASGRRDSTVVWMAIGISVLAGAASLGTLVWFKVSLPGTLETVLGQSSGAIWVSTIVLWLISACSQILFYQLLLLRHENGRAVNTPALIPLTEDIHNGVENFRPESVTTLHSHPIGDNTRYPVPLAIRDSETASSFRSSLTIAIRPGSFKAKSSISQQSHSLTKSHSFDTIPRTRLSQDSGFDDWDTSSVHPSIRETVLRSSPTARGPTTLPPIPGSRSPSPAKLLDGPFLPSTPIFSTRSQPSSPPPTSHKILRPPGRPRSVSSSAVGLPTLARPNTAPAGEEHIHPLFRPSSPSPPPSATPGTIVTAAPGSFVGLLIDEQTLSRMRSGSLPSRSLPSSPLVTSPAFFYDAEEYASQTSPRSPKSLNEETVPPIPDYILSAGSRTSLLGYGKRKNSLSSRDGGETENMS